MKKSKEKRRYGFSMVLKLTAVLCAVLALLCFAAPYMRKSDALRTAGEATMSEMRAAATAISYYSAQQISGMAQEPTIDANYKFLAGLLSQLNTQQNYQKSYLLYRENKTLRCLVDGSYRDNAQAGTDYFAPGEEYPIKDAYKPVKTVVDKIYNGKITGGYTKEIVTRQDFNKVAIACLPIYGANHTVVAVLCIETDPGNTSYHMVGSVNIYYAGLAFAAVLAICVLLLMIGRKYQLHKEQKKAAKEGLEQENPPQDNVPQPSAQEEAPADVAIQQPAVNEDEQQAPGSNIDTLQ
ncbi:MAG: hypothetical protein ACK5L0_00745 [Candidatus Fimivivens sp.]